MVNFNIFVDFFCWFLLNNFFFWNKILFLKYKEFPPPSFFLTLNKVSSNSFLINATVRYCLLLIHNTASIIIHTVYRRNAFKNCGILFSSFHPFLVVWGYISVKMHWCVWVCQCNDINSHLRFKMISEEGWFFVRNIKDMLHIKLSPLGVLQRKWRQTW